MLVPVVADMNHNNPIGQREGGELAGFRAMAAAGCVGIIHKARQGVGFADNAFARRRDLAWSAGLEVGAYDFATHDDVAANVAAFLATASISDKLSYWLDFEDNGASEMTGEQAAEFLDRVDQKIGRACGIYGGNRIFEEITDDDQEDVDWWALHPLWLCQYKTDPALSDADLATLKPRIHIPSQWRKPGWFLLQYTGDGHGPRPRTMPGLENGADLNVYDGTPDALRAAWALPAIAAAVSA